MAEFSVADELLTAYLDGQVTEAERRQVEQLLAKSAEHRDLLSGLRAVGDVLRELPRHQIGDGQLGDGFAQRVLKLAERQMLLEGLPDADGDARFVVEADPPHVQLSIASFSADRSRQVFAPPPGPILTNGGGWRKLAAAGLVLAASVLVMVASKGRRDEGASRTLARGTGQNPSKFQPRGLADAVDSAQTPAEPWAAKRDGTNFSAAAADRATGLGEMKSGKGDVPPAGAALGRGASPSDGSTNGGSPKDIDEPVKEAAPPLAGLPPGAPGSLGGLGGGGIEGGGLGGVESLDVPSQPAVGKSADLDGALAYQAERDHLNRLVDRLTPGVMVVHVEVSEQAWREDRFREVLEARRIAWSADAHDEAAKEPLEDNTAAKSEPQESSTQAVYVEAPQREIAAVLAALNDDALTNQRRDFLSLAVEPPIEVEAYDSLTRYYESGRHAALQSLSKSTKDRTVGDAQVEAEVAAIVRQLDEFGYDKQPTPSAADPSAGSSQTAEALVEKANAAHELAANGQHRGKALRLDPPSYGLRAALPGAAGGFGGVPNPPAPDQPTPTQPVPSDPLVDAPALVTGDAGENSPLDARAAAAFFAQGGDRRIPVWFFFHVRPATER